MNKNSKARRKEALKNFNKGKSTSQFLVPRTAPGSSLKMSTLTISIGNAPRQSHAAKVAAKRGKTSFNFE